MSRTCCSKVSVRTRLHSSRVFRCPGFLFALATSQRSVVECSGLKTCRTGMTCQFVRFESIVLDPSSCVRKRFSAFSVWARLLSPRTRLPLPRVGFSKASVRQSSPQAAGGHPEGGLRRCLGRSPDRDRQNPARGTRAQVRDTGNATWCNLLGLPFLFIRVWSLQGTPIFSSCSCRTVGDP